MSLRRHWRRHRRPAWAPGRPWCRGWPPVQPGPSRPEQRVCPGPSPRYGVQLRSSTVQRGQRTRVEDLIPAPWPDPLAGPLVHRLKELADAGLGRQEPDDPAQEAPVLQRRPAQPGHQHEHLLRGDPVRLGVTLAVEAMVVHARHVRRRHIQAQRDPVSRSRNQRIGGNDAGALFLAAGTAQRLCLSTCSFTEPASHLWLPRPRPAGCNRTWDHLWGPRMKGARYVDLEACGRGVVSGRTSRWRPG